MQTLSEQAHEHLIRMILNNEFSYQTIYSETKLARELNISRTPFRDAIHKLVQEGYFDIVPSKGFCLHTLSKQEIIETYQIRFAIECFCTVEITKNYREPDSAALFKELENLMDSMETIMNTSRNIQEFFHYDSKFHLNIIEHLNNKIFSNLFDTYMYRIKLLAESSLEKPGRMETTCLEHRAILNAMETGDVKHIHEVTLRHMNTPQDINLEALSGSITE